MTDSLSFIRIRPLCTKCNKNAMFMAAVYAASLMVPFLKSRRILRISAVCGNEPMLVVGKGGKASQLCAFLRVG